MISELAPEATADTYSRLWSLEATVYPYDTLIYLKRGSELVIEVWWTERTLWLKLSELLVRMSYFICARDQFLVCSDACFRVRYRPGENNWDKQSGELGALWAIPHWAERGCRCYMLYEPVKTQPHAVGTPTTSHDGTNQPIHNVANIDDARTDDPYNITRMLRQTRFTRTYSVGEVTFCCPIP